MVTTHSYGATLKNNATESEAFLYISQNNPRFRKPTREERKGILEKMGLPTSYSRTFDLIYMPEEGGYLSVAEVPADELVLVELKTTKKKLPLMPSGFFFGATDNEFQLAKRLDDKYVFCFVSLHPESLGYVMLTLGELQKLIKTQRLQYQINL